MTAYMLGIEWIPVVTGPDRAYPAGMRSWPVLPLLLAIPPAMAQEVAPEAAHVAHLDYEHVDTRMTVPVRIAGAGPYRFIIDTGAQRTVISRQLADTLGLPAGRTVRLTAVSGTSNVGTVTIPSLSVSVLGGSRIEAPALDARDMGAPGILGIDTLQGHALAIDLDAKSMAITPARRRGEQIRTAPDEIVIRAKSLFGQLVVTDAFAGGVRVRVILDTGSAVSMGNEALRRRLLRGRATVPVDLISVTGGLIRADYTTIPTVRIGALQIGDLPVAIGAFAPFKVFGVEDKPAILLGMDALKLFRRVRIDFANREVRLLMPRGTPRLRDDPGRLSSLP